MTSKFKQPKIDKIKALHVIEFVQLLKHTGDFYGQPFTLLDWEHEIIWNVYGTIKADGCRQYRMAYLEIPKKNGKTELVAALALYHVTCDGPGGQIFCCAADQKQARLVYNAAVAMIDQTPILSKTLKVKESTSEIINRRTKSVMRVLSAEAYTKHGINPTVVIFDELHAQPNRDLWDVMTFGAGAARKEPLWWVITTAGDDPDRHSIGWEVHENAAKVAAGELADPTLYVKIYGAPETADIYDEAVWYECNPSLGQTISIETVRSEALAARNSEASEKLFRWLRLNQWVSLKRIGWLPLPLWDETVGRWSRRDLLGRRCFIGLDLSSKIDLTSATALFPPEERGGEWRFITESWVPEENMAERQHRDHVPYDRWARDGYLNVTPGDVVDYAYIKNHIEKWLLEYDVAYICGDPWHLEILRQLMSREAQRKVIEIKQTMAGMTTPMGELERLFLAHEISHDVNPVNRWSFGNVVIATDGNENKKPIKNKSLERIDPTVSLINAMAGAVKQSAKPAGYEHGIRVV